VRFLRYAEAGRTSDVTTVSGKVGTDARALLAPDITLAGAAPSIAGTHYEWQGRLLPVGLTGNEYCVDMLDPYDYDRALAYNNDPTHGAQDQCAQRGFTMENTVFSYRGDGLGSPNSVISGNQVTGFDDFARITDRIRLRGQNR